MTPLAHIDIDLTGTIGLGELLVAVGTLALASFTWRLATRTEEDVRAQWRPVLMTKTTLDVNFTEESRSAVASIALYNEGRGPAMNARGWIVSETSTGRGEDGLHQIGTVAASREGNVLARCGSRNHRAPRSPGWSTRSSPSTRISRSGRIGRS